MRITGCCLALLAGLVTAPAFAQQPSPETLRAVRLEACHLDAKKRYPDRLYDQAMTQRRRAASVAECVQQWETAVLERTEFTR